MRLAGTVEVAYGADLTADPSIWTWTDITAYLRGKISTQRGRPDWASVTPAMCTLRLANPDGRFTPYAAGGTWYRGLPIRISLNPGTGAVLRFQGQVVVTELTWPTGKADYCEAQVTAAGALRRLRKGRTLRSPLYRAISTSGPVAHWSLEDAAGSVQAGSGLIGGGSPLAVTGTVTFGASGPAGAAQAADFSQGGQLSGAVPVAPSATSWRVEFGMRQPALAPGAFAGVVQWSTQGGVAVWEVDVSRAVDGGLMLQYAASDGAFVAFASGVEAADGAWHHVRIDASKSGGNIVVTVQLDGTTVISQTVALAFGPVTSALLNPAGGGDSVDGLSSVAVWAPYSPPLTVDTVAAFQGYAGELATARVARLCAEEHVPVTVLGTSSQAMGPQRTAKLLDLVQDCADVDAAIVVDGAGPGITYISSDSRYNQPVTLALDTAKRHIKLPLSPVGDDQRLVNDATIARSGGSSARYTDDVNIAAEGDYDAGTATLNVATDEQLDDQAAWRVHVGTVEQMRAPAILLNLIDTQDLVAPWLACDIGDRATLAGLYPQYPPGGMDLVIEAYTETWDQATWTVSLTCSPFAPWRIFQLAADTGDTGEFVGYLDVDDLELTADITSTQASFQVTTVSGQPLSTTADDYPMDLDIDGERVRVTSAPGAPSPQTLAVTRSINGVVAAHAATTPVSMWQPLALGM